MNTDLLESYTFDDANLEVSKLGMRLPNYDEILLIFRYRDLIGDFYYVDDDRTINHHYWTSTKLKNGHNIAMDFSFSKNTDDNTIGYATRDVEESSLDKFRVRPLK
jgi:hypothetical protein